MLLRSARITNFRSVEDSTEFGVEDITCLVGKNESGKTAILQALFKLNPVDGNTAYHRETEYPRRHLAEYEARHPNEPAAVIETLWELQERETAEVHEIVGPSALTSPKFRVTRRYPGPDGTSATMWGAPVDEGKALAFALKAAGLTEEEHAELAAQGKPKSIKELRELLGRVPRPATGLEKLIAHLDAHFKRGTAGLAFIDALEMPKFVYFSQYDRMPGQASIDLLIQRKSHNALTKDDEIILAFLALAGLTLEDIQRANVTENLIAKLEAVSRGPRGPPVPDVHVGSVDHPWAGRA